MEKAIEVKGLRKSFKDTEVLKGVDFEVKRGEIFALLGSNGAGKTTMVNILSTLLKPDGVMLLHSITRFGKPGKTNAFTRKYIFPAATSRR